MIEDRTPALPVATRRQVRRAALRFIGQDRAAFSWTLVLNAAAAAVGLVGPWLLGRIVNTVGTGGGVGAVDRYAYAIVACALGQLILIRYAGYVGHRFGERTSARIREQFVDRALDLPVAVVERAGAGDLTSRGTTDIVAVGSTLRDVGPEILIAAIQALFIIGAVLLLDPLIGMCGLLGLFGIVLAARWYLRRARTAYLAQGASNSAVAEVITATATGARTVDALGLRERRIGGGRAGNPTRVRSRRRAPRLAPGRDVNATWLRTRMRTLWLRSVLFPSIDVSYVIPVVAVLLVGGALLDQGAASLGAVVSCTVYLRQLSQPLDVILQQMERLQSGAAAFARVEGLALSPRVRPSTGPVPVGDRIEVRGVHYAYDGGRDVLHGVDLTIRPGERLALVGPSGAGKSTLGRLLVGIDRPGRGTVTVGGVPVADLDPDELRRHVVLVTQEHHVFHDTLRDNLLIAAPAATDEELWAALAVVGADWVQRLVDGLDTELGAGELLLDGGRSQQLALARVVLADPHTLILDEATALLDPTTARHTERALAAVLKDRTVIAIAHRLHTARDADRVAVMADGRLTELGTHDELVAADGEYAALWRSWHGQTAENTE